MDVWQIKNGEILLFLHSILLLLHSMILMEESISTSASTIRTLRQHLPEFPHLAYNSVSAQSSPHSSALPSPPDSPSSDSVSSLPSVSSSFFFSSAAASPPHHNAESDYARESTQGLIIPSLTLPTALGRPTAYGQTLGDMRLLVLGSKGAGKAFVTGLLLEDNEDVVDVGTWEDAEYGRVLRASTDWVEHRDAHGLEKFEPARNVEIFDLPGYDHTTNADEFLQSVKSIIQTPFYTVSDVLDPAHRPSSIVANLVSASSTPLHTALIFLLPSPPTALDNLIIESLSAHIPVVVLPRILRGSQAPAHSKLSSFRPSSFLALRTGLFRSPEILATLRSEAADRFLRWREVERAVDDIHAERRNDSIHRAPDGLPWDKARWESEWVSGLSNDVARRLREGTVTERNSNRGSGDPLWSCSGNPYDPLHLPSLLMFSLSLLGPLRERFGRTVTGFIKMLGDWNVRIALLNGFCVGLGIGLYLKS